MKILQNFRTNESSHFYLICIVFLLSTTFFFSAEILAYEITFIWNANDEPDLRGYKLYSRIGNPCPPYNHIDTYTEDELAIPLLPMVKVTNLEDDTKYYFVVTAFDTDGNESDYSEIISVTNSELGNANCPYSKSRGGGGAGSDAGGCFNAIVSQYAQRKPALDHYLETLLMGLNLEPLQKLYIKAQYMSYLEYCQKFIQFYEKGRDDGPPRTKTLEDRLPSDSRTDSYRRRGRAF